MNSFENFSFEYGVSEQITPLVKRVIAKNPGPFTYTGTGTFIVGTKELAVIDPGPIDNNHLNAIIKACGKSKISHIIITHTHNDHSPLSKPLQKKTGAPIYSFLNKKMVPSFFTNNSLNVMGWSTTVIVPPDGDMDEYLKSLEKLLDRNHQMYLPTHGTQIDDPHDLVNKYIEHRNNREDQIIKVIKSGSSMISEMVKIIYSDVDPGLHPAASMSTLAHLNRLVKNKIIKVEGTGLKGNYSIF